MKNFENILAAFNPWWKDPADFQKLLPEFRRPLFNTLVNELFSIPQILGVTGPRRVGKSTLLRQVIAYLLEQNVNPGKIIYYSFDDPALYARGISASDLIDHLFTKAQKEKSSGETFLFLDEIQRLERWELYLKKYYDLKYPVRIIISGSASSPIFKKSRESLLGRVKDYHLLPFSFREFVLYNLREDQEKLQIISSIHESGADLLKKFNSDGDYSDAAASVRIPEGDIRNLLDKLLKEYFLDGGFPEVWALPSWFAKQEYLYDNQVKKVIYEDLVLAAEFRKPELLKRFYISVLEAPGKEYSVSSVSRETDINQQQIEKYLPLLEMTDLIYRLPKYRSGPLRVRKGMMKFYLVDLALRNATLRLDDTLLSENSMMGLYAENLVYLALKKWRGTIQLDYYREKDYEVDFVIHTSPNVLLPIEVKYRNNFDKASVKGLNYFCNQNPKAIRPVIVTKNWSDHGDKYGCHAIPLPLFLLIFD